MKCDVKLLSSLEKVFFEKPLDLKEHTSGSMLKNEIYSFQFAYWGEAEAVQQKYPCRLQIESELKPYLEVRQVGYVPSLFPASTVETDDDYITKEPGLFPDPLYKVENDSLELVSGRPSVLWVTIEPNSKMVGRYPIFLKLLDECGVLLGEACFQIEILDAELPKQELHSTGWFHGDCLAKFYDVELMSEEYFHIVEKYLSVYSKFGHNMILTPIFTPPLDTLPGKERLTNQLVGVIVEDGKYKFDFTLLHRWIDLCRKYGIKYFEMAHFFTQWGAKHAPKIMATVDGVYKKIFGWETDALGEEYRLFLQAFLPQLITFLTEEGVMEDCYFHVSDEPEEEHEEQYRMAKEILGSYISDEQIIDALSSYRFYEKGILANPIISNDRIYIYMEHGVKNLWTYYCMGQRRNVANRFMALPSYRNRILGCQLYKYDIRGFLHWGFNFWFTRNSTRLIDPYIETAAGGEFPSGDAYVVYPLDKAGEVVPSLRLYVFNEALQDMRALRLLESLTDRDTVHRLLEEVNGFASYPRNTQYILQLREKINKQIYRTIRKE